MSGRGVTTQRLVARREGRKILILGASILIWASVAYTTGELAIPLIGAIASVAVYIPLEVVHRRGFKLLARNHMPMRFIGLLPIALGVHDAFTGTLGMAAGLGVLGPAFICFPKAMARASNLGWRNNKRLRARAPSGGLPVRWRPLWSWR